MCDVTTGEAPQEGRGLAVGGSADPARATAAGAGAQGALGAPGMEETGPAGAAEVVQRLEGFFLGPEMTGALGEFFGSERAAGLDFSAPEGEQPLENFEAFKAYSQLVERLLAPFLEAESISEEQLFEALLWAREEQGDGPSFFTCLDYCISAGNYTSFMELASDWAWQ